MKNKVLLLIAVATLGLTATTLAQVPSYVPSNGLVGYWPFNGNANDESGNANNGTVNGATLTTDRNGNANQAYSFDGVDDYISCNPIFGINEISVSVWFKKDGLGGHLVSQNNWIDAQNVSFASAYEKSSNVLSVGCNNGNCSNAGSQIGTLVPYNLNSQWHNRITTISSNGALYDYLDGQMINSFTISNFQWCNSVNSLLKFGAWWNSDIQSWEGQLDDIGIWNRALTQQEITALYNGCQLAVNTQPISQTININNNAQFIVGSSDPNATYQWQTDLGVGFQNVSNAGQYSGASNDTLSVANVSMSNNNQSFRCIINSGSCADTSNVAVLTINNNVGIHEIAQHNLFSVFPNPAHNVINVKADHTLIGSVFTIYDNTGKAVQTGKINAANTSIELSNLSSGFYMFSVGENRKQSFKIIKE